jgi:hypothetical protein
VKSKSGKEKIDHSMGTPVNKYTGNWELSTAGIHAKDMSDSVCRASWFAWHDTTAPVTDYNVENERLGVVVGDKQKQADRLMTKLMKVYAKKGATIN